MTDDIRWELTTFEGNRQAQQRKFMALSLREKLQRVEDMGDVVAALSPASKPAPKTDREPGHAAES